MDEKYKALIKLIICEQGLITAIFFSLEINSNNN